MNCSEFEAELYQLVETRGDVLSSAAVQHVEDCVGCRTRWRDRQLIDTALQALPSVQAPDWLADAVMRQLLPGGSVEPMRSPGVGTGVRSGRRGQWLAVSIAAACLFVLISLGERRQLDRVTGVPVTPPVVAGPPVEVAKSVAAVFEDLRAEYRELAAETNATAREFAAVLPPNVTTSWMSNAPAVELDSPAERSAPPPGAVTEIGRSVGNRIGQAIDFLWVAIPETVPRG